jgi:dolichol-phosphate mannosyltransferase
MAHELTVIVPTLNERDNIGLVVAKLHEALKGINWEVVFVDDDSTDSTLDVLKSLAQTDDRVRFILRIGRRGLSSACLEGMGSASSPYLAVMDSDLQHDEALLPKMLDCLRNGQADLVVGSRYVEGGGVEEFPKWRHRLSRLAAWFCRVILRIDLSDPMSGFFMLRREVFERAVRSMSGMGFKILLDLISVKGASARIKELPFVFRGRRHGESKLDTLVAWELLLLVVQRLTRDVLPGRFVMFVIVGSFGAVLHLAVLYVALRGFGMVFLWAQSIAAAVAMVFNFFTNNLLTYRDLRLRGAGHLAVGLVSFVTICSIGAITNVIVAEKVYLLALPWWLAGVTGAVIGAVWNFAVSSTLVWRLARKIGTS